MENVSWVAEKIDVSINTDIFCLFEKSETFKTYQTLAEHDKKLWAELQKRTDSFLSKKSRH